jgi:hypothetical protein|nr:MAG TPA: hypothetical protein [Caudoviricetes sp.]
MISTHALAVVLPSTTHALSNLTHLNLTTSKSTQTVAKILSITSASFAVDVTSSSAESSAESEHKKE